VPLPSFLLLSSMSQSYDLLLFNYNASAEVGQSVFKLRIFSLNWRYAIRCVVIFLLR
jgi:hypothetical protein